MTLSLPGERSIAAATPASPFAFITRVRANARAARARRTALAALLELDSDRLDDLGINRQDVMEALASKSSRPGAALSAARSRSAQL